MAMTNQLTQGQEARNSNITVIQTDTGEIKLSTNIVRNYLVSGNGNVTDQEIKLFIALCSAHKLNPFIREAHLIKYGNSPITMIISKDVFQKRANKNPLYKGKKSGVICLTKEGEVVYREGTFFIKNKEDLAGAWCEVYKKGDYIPERIEVSLNEYIGLKTDGAPNSQWAKRPATMIRKVAVAQALREVFTEEFQGLYVPEEFGGDSDSLDTTNIDYENISAGINVEQKVETIIEEIDPMAM